MGRDQPGRRGDGICLLLCCLPPAPGSAEGLGGRTGRGEGRGGGRTKVVTEGLHFGHCPGEQSIRVSGGTGAGAPAWGGPGDVTAPAPDTSRSLLGWFQ